MFTRLSDSDIQKIDKLLWLSSPAFKRNPGKHESLYSSAVQIGKETAGLYPVKPGDIASALVEYSLGAVKYFAQSDGDRAYYLPGERKIYINDSFVSEMAGYFASQEVTCFTRETIVNALILHELFHHIEETLTQPTDSLLKSMHNTFVPPVYRDIAAFSYVNTLMPDIACQVIDLYWLKKRHPEKYAEFDKI